MRLLRSMLLLTGLAAPLAGQAPSRTSLTLSEALDIAKRNNPQYLQSINGRTRASAAVRSRCRVRAGQQ